jgi:BirA family biotin operon repressor/biotin-[acetyl-CoA-carboxylase] ligase
MLFSFLLRPDVEAERALLLTLLAGAAMAEACREVTGADVRCKWPNDLILGGAKLGGILTEARVREGRIQHLVVGVGLNADAAPDGMEGAAALGSVDRPRLLTVFFKRFRERYVPQGEGFAHIVISAYVPLSDTLGKRVRASRLDGGLVEGTALDLDPAGNLVVKTESGLETVGFGEVTHLR